MVEGEECEWVVNTYYTLQEFLSFFLSLFLSLWRSLTKNYREKETGEKERGRKRDTHSKMKTREKRGDKRRQNKWRRNRVRFQMKACKRKRKRKRRTEKKKKKNRKEKRREEREWKERLEGSLVRRNELTFLFFLQLIALHKSFFFLFLFFFLSIYLSLAYERKRKKNKWQWTLRVIGWKKRNSGKGGKELFLPPFSFVSFSWFLFHLKHSSSSFVPLFSHSIQRGCKFFPHFVKLFFGARERKRGGKKKEEKERETERRRKFKERNFFFPSFEGKLLDQKKRIQEEGRKQEMSTWITWCMSGRMSEKDFLLFLPSLLSLSLPSIHFSLVLREVFCLSQISFLLIMYFPEDKFLSHFSHSLSFSSQNLLLK